MQETIRTEAELSYRELFNKIDQGFCVLEVLLDDAGTPNDYRFLDVNPFFERMTGIRTEEALSGKTVRQIIPTLEQKWIDIYGRIAMTGRPEKFIEHSEVMQRTFNVFGYRFGAAESRQVALLFTDITEQVSGEKERQKLTAELESERARLQYLFTNAPAFVATLRGSDHVFELTNPAYMQLIGHRDVIGLPVRQALPEVSGQGFFSCLDEVYRDGKPYVGREMGVKLQTQPDGPMIESCLNFVYQPIFETDGTVSGIFVHGVDVTEEVQARKNAETANRTKDEFLATLSHELRTPLGSMLGWTMILSQENIDEETQKRAIEVIQRNTRLQSQLIDDLLDVSRIISGKLRLDVTAVDLRTLIDSVIQVTTPAALAKEIQLQAFLGDDLNLVSGDSARLHQVIWNLLSNAVKFTPKGGKVDIKLQRADSSLEVIVSDNGIGIAPQVLPRVFERFQQGSSATTRNHGGLGIGLAIVRHLVEMHGGTVHVESEGQDKGAAFIIRLPLIPVRPDNIRVESSPNSTVSAENLKFESGEELKGMRVLIVDDNDDSLMMIKTLLERSGAEVTPAHTAEEALAKLQDEKPDVLLSDIGMPGEDGFSLINRVRALDREHGGDTPAAALTAYARTDDRLRVLRSGFQLHLPKPVEPQELIAAVANLWQHHGKE